MGYSAPYSHHTPAMVSVKWCRNALRFPRRDAQRGHEQEQLDHARINIDSPGDRMHVLQGTGLAQHEPRALAMFTGLGVKLRGVVEFGADGGGIHGRKL